MIRATEKHDSSSLDADGKLFLDLDLGILAAGTEVYKRYAEAIRQEYSFARTACTAKNAARFWRAFDKENLFTTPTKYEKSLKNGRA
jgi:predicted metal-dependent HD superfamily phosphohydrolase